MKASLPAMGLGDTRGPSQVRLLPRFANGIGGDDNTPGFHLPLLPYFTVTHGNGHISRS